MPTAKALAWYSMERIDALHSRAGDELLVAAAAEERVTEGGERGAGARAWWLTVQSYALACRSALPPA